MSDEAGVITGGEVASAAPEPITTNDAPLTVREAVTAAAERHKRERETPTTDGAEPAATETKSAVEAGAAPLDEVTGETQVADPAEVPSLKLPRSWASEQAEHWAKLDPVTQEFLLEQDRKASDAVRKSQNEAAQERNSIKEAREQADKVRQEYEAKLPALMQALHDTSPFADVRTMDDVIRMAADDPFRKIQWDAYQQKMVATHTELQQAEQRKAAEHTEQWSKYQSEESTKAAEMHPELADPEKSKKYGTAVAEMFRDKGFTDNELGGMTKGEKFSPYDHRFQSIILDAIKYREAQKAPPKAIAKPVPQVLRPGIAPARGASGDANIQEASRRFTQAPNIRNAVALYAAKQANKR